MSGKDASSMFDTYTLKARLWPALIAGIPAVAVVAVMFPNSKWWQGGMLVAGSAVGLTFLLAQMVRIAGKRKEPQLFARWGGKPTTRYLRHRESPLDKHTLARYHRNIEQLSADLKMPTVGGEAADPAAADAAYEAATRMLINKTRETRRFRLLFLENVHYGFCRNLWGLKPLGIVFVLASVGLCGWLVYVDLHAGKSWPASPIGAAAIAGVWLLLWCFWFTPAWIKVAADAYAERLLEASDTLLRDLAGQPKPAP